MRQLLSIFLLAGCTVGLQPVRSLEEPENQEGEDEASSPSWEPSEDTDTNNPDTETDQPSDLDEALIPNLITSILPTYGSTVGGTEVTIFGGPFTGDASVTIGGYPANVLSNAGSQIRVLTPFSNLTSTAEVRVDMSDGFGLSPQGFTYYEEGAGATGALGRIEMIEYLGGYWQDEFGNPITDGGKIGSFAIGFTYPVDFQWWEFYTSSLDSCSMGAIDANGDDVADSTNYYSYSDEVLLMDIASSTITLSGQSTHSLNRGSQDTSDINYFFYQLASVPETDIIDNSFFTLDIPDGDLAGMTIPQFARASKKLVPSSPVMTGTNPPTISRTQTFTWTPSGGDWVRIRMFHVNDDGFIDSNIYCVAEDDGLFTISNFHQNWIPNEVMYIQFSRVFESKETMPHNNSEARTNGVYTVIGVGFMNY